MWVMLIGNKRYGPPKHNSLAAQVGEGMIFDPLFLVHYVRQFLVLEPGNLINTDTRRASA
jgi:hypothetical protein